MTHPGLAHITGEATKMTITASHCEALTGTETRGKKHAEKSKAKCSRGSVLEAFYWRVHQYGSR